MVKNLLIADTAFDKKKLKLFRDLSYRQYVLVPVYEDYASCGRYFGAKRRAPALPRYHLPIVVNFCAGYQANYVERWDPLKAYDSVADVPES